MLSDWVRRRQPDRDAARPAARRPARPDRRRRHASVQRLPQGRHRRRARAPASSARRSSSTGRPTATRRTAAPDDRHALLGRDHRHRQPGGHAAERRARTAARPPPSPTTSPARSSTRARATRPGRAGARQRSGDQPIRSDDLFFGAKPGDVQPDWVDLDKVAIPQADEQQRLLANLIEQMNLDRKPLPRFWYFPRGEKAAVVMTGDDHGNGGTAGRFDQYKAAQPAAAARSPTGSASAAPPTSTRAPRSPTRRPPRSRARASRSALHVTHQLRGLDRQRSARVASTRASSPPSRANYPEPARRPPPTAPTASPGATGRPSRRSSSSTASGSTPTTTTGRRPGSRTGRGCSPARACRCASPTSTAR